MKKYILAFLTAAAMVGCTDNFEDYNTDNTGVGDDAKLLQKARDEFERATMPLAALLMNNVAQKALMGKSLDDV